ncbi:mechanosensitive ion channel family protein [Nocardia sp. 004]|uniref:mechanosensitive ion channel family protein n=1 Tax=Nocardia sp. 004 TaxID=3385978 RepID=UPI00399F6B57
MRTSGSAIDFQQGLSGMWSSLVMFGPELAGFLLILFIGWLVAKAVAMAVHKVLRRAGFDRFVARGGIRELLSRSRYAASEIVAKLVYAVILLIALQLGLSVFGPNPVSDMVDDLIARLPEPVVAVGIVVIAGAVAQAVRDMVGSMLGCLGEQMSLAELRADACRCGRPDAIREQLWLDQQATRAPRSGRSGSGLSEEETSAGDSAHPKSGEYSDRFEHGGSP